MDGTFANRPPWQREICDAVIGYVESVGPVHLDAVRVGVFLKRDRTLVELRPLVRSVNTWIMLPRPVEHPRIGHRETVSATRVAHVVKLTRVAEVDGELRAWLTEAYAAAGTDG